MPALMYLFMIGGFFDGPTRHTRDPRTFLNGVDLVVFGEPFVVFGEPPFVFGESTPPAILLVNKGPGVSYLIPTAENCFGEPECVFR